MAFEIEVRGQQFWARLSGEPAFFVGTRLRYGARVGLGSAGRGAPPSAVPYDAADHRPEFGLWADLIAPTVACEGGSFTALNSYDRAGFSFGIGQFAAHVPDGAFVGYLHRLLRLAEAAFYVPDWRLRNGRLHRRAGAGASEPLETATSTAALRAALNPDAREIGPAELQAAARLIHWVTHHEGARRAQVVQMIDDARAQITHRARRVGPRVLTGAEACVIFDLCHHGRAGAGLTARLATALADAEPLSRLLEIGAARWGSRVDQLRAEILSRPVLGRHVWDAARSDFVRAGQ